MNIAPLIGDGGGPMLLVPIQMLEVTKTQAHSSGFALLFFRVRAACDRGRVQNCRWPAARLRDRRRTSPGRASPGGGSQFLPAGRDRLCATLRSVASARQSIRQLRTPAYL